MSRYRNILMMAVGSLFVAGLLLISGCTSSSTTEETQEATDTDTTEEHEAVELQIFAANSLSSAMDEVQALYMESHDWVTFADTQYEGSGTLVEMLNAGSYADILITASAGSMVNAVDNGDVDENTSFDMFTNDLVIVAGEDNDDITELTLEDLASGEYTVAVGDSSVPAGTYAKQALSTTDPACWISTDGAIGSDTAGTDGTFEGTPLEGLVTEASSVGNVCSYANSGDVDVALVYSSDVYRYGGVKIVCEIDDGTHKDIVYPAALCSDSTQSEAAAEFLEWATTDEEALKIWQEWGFELIA